MNQRISPVCGGESRERGGQLEVTTVREQRLEPPKGVFKPWRKTSEPEHDGTVLQAQREPLIDLLVLLAEQSASVGKSYYVEIGRANTATGIPHYMNSGYLPWAFLGLLAYTFVAPLMKVATSAIPSNVAVFISNLILVGAAGVVVLFTDGSVTPYLTHPKAPYAYAAGLALAVGIIAYYRALAVGPVSVVTPIFGMFLVTSSLIGITVLGESLTIRKAAGIGFAILAVYLTAIE